jgi:CheY-like chemotaxis protein
MPSVLIVDDEPDIRFLVSRMLTGDRSTWRVEEAGSGADAVRCWRETRPDVVVLDQRMPGLTGLETAARILAENSAQTIILFTAFRDPQLEEEAAALGIRTCVPKSEIGRLITEVRARGEESQAPR